MHGSRKPRLPIQAEKLTHQYPEDTPLDEWTGNNQIEELIDFIQETQESNSNKAREHLLHSQSLMMKQYDKKLNTIAFSKLENGDDVLIENVYRNKKGGKLQGRWLGPYPVTKVNRENLK